MTNQVLLKLKRFKGLIRICWNKLLLRKRKILILTANPKTTQPLRFGQEVKEIQNAIKNRKKFDVKIALAIEYKELPDLLRQPNLYIIHFIGHGNKDGVIVDDGQGYPEVISLEVLKELFELCTNRSVEIECVILNACDSASPASQLSKYINYAIGMEDKIEDEPAIKFAIAFYNALAKGDSLEIAFQFGRIAYKQAKPDNFIFDLDINLI